MAKHLDKKELKKDPLATTVFRVLDWAKNNRTKAIQYVSAIAAMVVIATVFAYQKSNARTEISQALFKIMNMYSQSSPEFDEAALALCEESLKAHRKTTGTDHVLFYKGNLLFRLGRYSEALNVFRGFLESFPKHYHSSLVERSIAYCHEELSDYESAKDIFLKIMSLEQDSYLKAQTLLDLARVENLLGNTDEAKEIYSRLINDYEDTRYKELALMRLDFLH